MVAFSYQENAVEAVALSTGSAVSELGMIDPRAQHCIPSSLLSWLESKLLSSFQEVRFKLLDDGSKLGILTCL